MVGFPLPPETARTEEVSVDVPPAADRATDPHRSPVGGGSRRPALLVAIAAVALISLSVLKPWGASPVGAAADSAAPTSSPPLSPMTPDASPPEATAGPASLVGPHGVVRRGPLTAGTYDYGDVDGRGFNIAFTVPAGWAWDGTSLRTGERGEDAVITFFTGDVQVYVDACHWRQPVLGPWGSDLASLMAALAVQRGSRASVPVARAAPALDLRPRWPGMAIELTVPSSLTLSACDGGEFRRWVYEPERFDQVRRVSFAGPGERDYVWAVQILSERLIIDASTGPGTSALVRSEVMAILRSIVVGHWG